MRFGDLAMLRWENIEGGQLNYVMGKTGNEVKVNIRRHAQRFLDYYRTGEDSSNSFILPFLEGFEGKGISSSALRRKASTWNAVANKHLKTIQAMIGIDDNLSMHVSRHSFAQYGVNKGLSKYKMQMLLGHASVKTTEQYLKMIDVTAVNEAMDMIFE
jgi:site-specific recombinase XerD